MVYRPLRVFNPLTSTWDKVGDDRIDTHAHDEYLTPAEGDAAYQPLDSDLTAIAALATTSFGRALLALADAAAGRTALGLGTASTHATGDYDAAGAAAAAQAASQPLDSDLTAIAALTTTSFGRGLLALADAAAGRTALGLGTAALAATGDFDAAGAAAAAQAASQPLDSDLTAFAGLAIAADKLPYGTGSHTLGLADLTAAGRALIDDADAAAQRTTLGLGTAATHATGDYDAAGAAAAAQAASQPLDSDLTAIAALSTTSYGRSLLALADAAALRTAAGSVIGTDVEAHDADLTAIAALTSAADKVPYSTGAQAWALADLTSFGRSLIDDANAAAGRTTLGAEASANKGIANGYASLDSGILVPIAQLPVGTGASQVAAGNHTHAGTGDAVLGQSGVGGVTIPGLQASPNKSGAAGRIEFDSALSGWTTHGSFDTLDANSTIPSHLFMSKNSSGGVNVDGVYRAVTAGFPRTWTCQVADARMVAQYNTFGMLLTESAPGKLATFGFTYSVGWVRETWTNRTTRAATTTISGTVPSANSPGFPVYLRLVAASTTSVDLYISFGGLVWIPIATGFNPNLTIANWGVYASGYASIKMEAAFDWVQES